VSSQPSSADLETTDIQKDVEVIAALEEPEADEWSSKDFARRLQKDIGQYHVSLFDEEDLNQYNELPEGFFDEYELPDYVSEGLEDFASLLNDEAPLRADIDTFVQTTPQYLNWQEGEVSERVMNEFFSVLAQESLEEVDIEAYELDSGYKLEVYSK